MVRGSRFRRYCKWGGLSVSVLLAVAWAASLLILVIASYGRLHVAFGSGGFGFSVWKQTIETRFDLWGADSMRWLPTVGPKRWGLPNLNPPPALMFTAYVPFWCLFPLAAIPTVILWRRDRKIPPGHCQTCGYDLTGNTTGVCSECGIAAESRAVN